jgi:hypothetical protein
MAKRSRFATPDECYRLHEPAVATPPQATRANVADVLHVNVTTAPTASWVSRQWHEAFPFETIPRYLIRDRDGIYGIEVRRCLASLNIEAVVTAVPSPWQNPYVERIIGSLHRDCLDQVIV